MDSKWARDILSLQKDDGSWGYFHTLSEPRKFPLTTEQALRRLQILGYTIKDKPIQRAVVYMEECLAGKLPFPDRREKTVNWDTFVELMLSTWIRRFTDESEKANRTALTWAGVISRGVKDGVFDAESYRAAYEDAFGFKLEKNRTYDISDFYHVSIAAGNLDEETEAAVFDYWMNHGRGIYYVYDRRLSDLPEEFASKRASHYLGAVEMLSKYSNNLRRLGFVKDWLIFHRNADGKWDMGSATNDKIYFPLSDSWRLKAAREADCTYRIQNLLNAINT